MTGRLEDIISDGRKMFLTFSTEEDIGDIEKLLGEQVEVKVTKKRGKRSLNANSYMWELCTLIADKLSDDGEPVTKEDVYRQTVREVGVFRDIPMPNEYADTLRTAWEMHGTAWITEIVDYGRNNTITVRCYYGTSLYNTKQMSRVITALTQDCDALNIPRRTPDEIANMLSLWEQERKT